MPTKHFFLNVRAAQTRVLEWCPHLLECAVPAALALSVPSGRTGMDIHKRRIHEWTVAVTLGGQEGNRSLH